MQQTLSPTHEHKRNKPDRTVWLRWVSILAMAAGVLLLMSVLPMQEVSQRLEDWVGSLGVLGPLVFVAIYIAATVLMVPGSALTLVAGAVFGLWLGTAVVSLASTAGAATAFLIARHLARDRIAGTMKAYPAFNAIDRAIGRGGWKIVLLLRLSPVVPFNVQNYLYGLTAISFWPAVGASWAGMLPGTIMFVYMGYAGRAAAASMQAGGPGGTGKTVLLAVGLLATLFVTLYVTRLSARAVRSYTQSPQFIEESNMAKSTQDGKKTTGKRGMIVLAGIAVVVFSAGAYARWNPQYIKGLLASFGGPPAVVLAEAYGNPPPDQAEVFDHSAFDAVLKKHVDPDGWVDYKALSDDTAPLDAYIASLADAPFDRFRRDEKLAYLINAYNAFTLRLILDYYPLKSIKDIPAAKRWDAVRWELAGGTYSLNQIEHELIRPKFIEPRVHFVLVCAAYSCPKLLNEVYTGERLEDQLSSQMVYAHTHDRWFRFDQDGGTVYLTPLYNWYGGDFEAVSDSVLDYVAEIVPELREAMESGRVPKVRWLDYDWKLNDVLYAP